MHKQKVVIQNAYLKISRGAKERTTKKAKLGIKCLPFPDE